MCKILLLSITSISIVSAIIKYDLNAINNNNNNNNNYNYNKDYKDYFDVKNSRNFTGKVVLVTGSNSGIGEAIVKLFAILGARVVITGRKETEIRKVAQEVQQLSPNGLKPLEVVADVTKLEDLKRLIRSTIKTYGQLDVLVNNAGIGSVTDINDKDFIDKFDRVFQINVRSGLQLIQLAIPYLQTTNGTVISTSSIASFRPGKSPLPYGASKATLDYITKALAVELGPNIRVNAINPGFILTDELKEFISADRLSKVVNTTPLRRTGQPIDVAKGVAFLASIDSQFITGANLVIDGGILYT